MTEEEHLLKNGYTLEIHHINYNKKDNKKCNLITLCISCNIKANYNRDYWKNYYKNKMLVHNNCPHFVRIKSIKKINKKLKVYNFECSPNNNYFANYFLVHNCCIKSFYGKTYECRLVEDIIADFKVMGQRDVKNIKIMDELFILNKNRTHLICDKIIDLGYDFNIWTYARIDIMDEKLLKKLKKAGVNWLAYGIESGNDVIRQQIMKGNFNKTKIKDIIKMTKDNGIHIVGNFMFGFWEDNLDTMKETLDFAIELNCEYANFYCTVAYPGSKLYKEMKEKGVSLPTDYTQYAQMSPNFKPLPTKYLSSKDVLKFRDNAFLQYYNNVSYLSMMRKTFGQQVLEEVLKMIKIPLRRNY
jgi:hypothetical protein